ncbi:glutamine amidotransferase-related protein [Kibdelosporangium aridum]|uniref:glutamine amidotransferase-related protein n=1 Tax=Kibdelosporangium aridum TaxID=2030 RepID=UPI0007C5198A
MTGPCVLIIDNGSLSIGPLRRKFERLHLDTEVVRVADAPTRVDGRYQALVLSGTKVPAHVGDYRHVVDLVLRSGLPTLGVCGGMHILALAHGAKLERGQQRVGNYPVELETDGFLAGLKRTVSLFQRHTLYVNRVPTGFSAIGWSESCPVEVILSDDGRILGAQAHLEFRDDGFALIQAFARLVPVPATQDERRNDVRFPADR